MNSAVGLPQREIRASRGLTLSFAVAVLAAVIMGYSARDEFYLTPASGMGYALGVIGGLMMLLLLLYPERKSRQLMRGWGAIRHWFRLHMILGVLGPLCVLFHCNFSLGATNSNIALLCMGLMVTSGLIGRFIYASLHHGLYGQKVTLQELALNKDFAEALLRDDQSHGRPLPEGISRDLETLRVWATQQSGTLTTLWKIANVERRSRALRKAIGGGMRKTPRPGQTMWLEKHLDDYISALTQLLRFSFFERLFAWWHALHMPIFVLLIITGLIHVWAVHNY
jgi:hypothetical protein